MEGEPEAMRALDRRIEIVQAQIAEARDERDYQQRRMDRLADERRDLWREGYWLRHPERRPVVAPTTIEREEDYDEEPVEDRR